MLHRRKLLIALSLLFSVLWTSQGQAQQANTVQLSQRVIPSLNLKVEAKCLGDRAFFMMKNLGKRWPERARLMLFQKNENAVVTQRALKMKENQTVSFKARADGPGGVGLIVDAPWADEVYTSTDRLSCVY